MTRYTVIEEDNTCECFCYLLICALVVAALPFAAIYGLILLCARSCCRPCCMENCPGCECCWRPSCLCIDAVPRETYNTVAVAPATQQNVTVNQIHVANTMPAVYPPYHPGPHASMPFQGTMGAYPDGYGPQMAPAGVHMGNYPNPAGMPSTAIPSMPPAGVQEPPPSYSK